MEFILSVVIITGVFFLVKRLRGPLPPKTTGTGGTGTGGGGGGGGGDGEGDEITQLAE
jgi:hypothetical protein